MTYGARRRRKVDANCKAIVETLRKIGVRVHVTNEDWDLTVQFNGMTALCEVRPADKPRTARKGRQAEFQKEFSVYWLQNAGDCHALRTTLQWWAQEIMKARK